MKIVYTLKEVKNILCDWTTRRVGGNPSEVTFVHKFSDSSGETDVQNVATIDRVEIDFGTSIKDEVVPKTEDDTEWIIWSIEHDAWWAPNHNGYVKKRKQAGRYSYFEACQIVRGANIGEHDKPNEAMIRIG